MQFFELNVPLVFDELNKFFSLNSYTGITISFGSILFSFRMMLIATNFFDLF